MGAHPIKEHGKLVAFCFSVWAPNASEVSVIGSFNGWDGFKSRMKRQENGVWSTVINGVPSGASYKYLIRTRFGETFYRTDPCAKYAEPRPLAASRSWCGSFRWNDAEYRAKQEASPVWNSRPMAIYEIHAGSWRESKRGGPMNYRELAESLCEYLCEYGLRMFSSCRLRKTPITAHWAIRRRVFLHPLPGTALLTILSIL